MTVNKELVKLWVDTLRSGKYQQGKKALRSKDDKFCCLGVLCDISKDTLDTNWVLGNAYDKNHYSLDGFGGVLPESVVNYLGVTSENYNVQISHKNSKLPNFVLEKEKEEIYLTNLNDDYGLSFDQIADVLEEEFLNENTTIDVA